MIQQDLKRKLTTIAADCQPPKKILLLDKAEDDQSPTLSFTQLPVSVSVRPTVSVRPKCTVSVKKTTCESVSLNSRSPLQSHYSQNCQPQAQHPIHPEIECRPNLYESAAPRLSSRPTAKATSQSPETDIHWLNSKNKFVCDKARENRPVSSAPVSIRSTIETETSYRPRQTPKRQYRETDNSEFVSLLFDNSINCDSDLFRLPAIGPTGSNLKRRKLETTPALNRNIIMAPRPNLLLSVSRLPTNTTR